MEDFYVNCSLPLKARFVSTSLLGVLVGFAGSTPGWCGSLAVSSYSMNNGGSGTYDYRDITYSNCPAVGCDTTGTPLSGGTGRLTNGVIPTTNWNDSSNSAGWIGWSNQETNGTNPAITFNFAGSQTVNTVAFWYDNSLGYGGVTEPASVSIDGVNYVLATNNVAGPQEYTISGLNLTGNSVNLQFFQGVDAYVMIGQVEFNPTTNAAPEPATASLMGCALALAATLTARRRKVLKHN